VQHSLLEALRQGLAFPLQLVEWDYWLLELVLGLVWLQLQQQGLLLVQQLMALKRL
jgi:hypothetical protein